MHLLEVGYPNEWFFIIHQCKSSWNRNSQIMKYKSTNRNGFTVADGPTVSTTQTQNLTKVHNVDQDSRLSANMSKSVVIPSKRAKILPKTWIIFTAKLKLFSNERIYSCDLLSCFIKWPRYLVSKKQQTWNILLC